jgi:hypothetical protein
MTTRLPLLGVLAAALIVPAGAAAAPAHRDCPARPGTLARTSMGRVWHAGPSLYGCTTVYGRRPHARRLGPWRGAGAVRFDGVTAAWTVPLVRDGVRSDRVWAASAEDGRRWLSGTRLVPASAQGPAREGRVQRLLLRSQGAAWVTRAGEVVLALADPQAPLAPSRQLVLVGRWTAPAPATWAPTATLTTGEGDGDECGGVNPYTLTVRPDAAAPAVGATWTGGWSRPFCG